MNQDIFNPTRVTATVGGKEIIFETGRLANQAHGAVWVQCGGTVVLVSVSSQALEFDKGFFPLTVEYSEKMYAAGRIPGSSSAARSAVPPSVRPWSPASSTVPSVPCSPRA